MKAALFLYNLIILIIMPFAFIIGYIKTKMKGGEEGFCERFGLIRLKGGPRKKSVWFHCASVGEVRSISDIVSNLRKNYSDLSIIVSTMTVTGRREAADYIKADESFLLPIENGYAIEHIIKLLGVKIFFIVDTELWPNLIYTASAHTNLLLINGRISDRTFKSYYRFRLLLAPFLKRFTAIFTKSAEDAEKFEKVAGSNKNILHTGSIKLQKRKNPEDMEPVTELEGKKFFLAASTHSPEEEIIIKAFIKGGNSYDKLVIAPRHIIRGEEIKETAIKLGMPASLYSEGKDTKILIIDKFGMLERLYVMAEKIFIGGSISHIGGHNIYEALQFRKNAAYGPNMNNFSEIIAPAEETGVAITLKNGDEIADWLQKEDKKGDFNRFFEITDEKNKKTIREIEDIINALLDTKTDSKAA